MDEGYLSYLSLAIAFVVAFTIHEFAHALIANKLGDETAKHMGRMSLNPIKHVDPVGTLILPILLIVSGSPFVFGWAKPVPVNVYNLRQKGKYAHAWVSLAGPLSNFLVAILVSLFWRLSPEAFVASWSNNFINLLSVIMYINVIFGIFNLIPIPPLDGSHILMSLLPESQHKIKEFLNQYGWVLLMLIILFGANVIILPIAQGILSLLLPS
ncbi:MAG: site-2 protease family protein [Candidatus Moranbacteria bacterium]|nr:site-2 protease family protein [Candidatus Moranbacteria bacterium]